MEASRLLSIKPFGMFTCSLLSDIITKGDAPLNACASHLRERMCFELVINIQKVPAGIKTGRQSGTAALYCRLPGSSCFYPLG